MMTVPKTIHVSPAPGRVVHDPARGDELPAAGRTVPRSPYWLRRIQDNDVILRGAEAGGEQAKSTKAEKGAK